MEILGQRGTGRTEGRSTFFLRRAEVLCWITLHVKDRASSSGRNLPPRDQSRQRPRRGLSQGCGLRDVREDAERGMRAACDARAGLLPRARSLSSCALASPEREFQPMDAVAADQPRPATSQGLRHQRPRLAAPCTENIRYAGLNQSCFERGLSLFTPFSTPPQGRMPWRPRPPLPKASSVNFAERVCSIPVNIAVSGNNAWCVAYPSALSAVGGTYTMSWYFSSGL